MKVQQECPDLDCRETQRRGLTDNARVKCLISIKPMKGQAIEIPPLATPRRLLEHNQDPNNKSRQLQLEVCCARCQTVILTIVPNQTKELLYLRLSDIVTHNKGLPLLYVPGRPESNGRIPDDARYVCALAHQFDAEVYLKQHIAQIRTSLESGRLRARLQAKMAQKPRGQERLTYLRIGVGLRKLGQDTPILELWPVGHRSPKHQHGGCAGSVRVLHGILNVKLYDNLWDKDPMRFKHGDGGLDLPPGEHRELLLKTGDTTWLNRSNWYVHEVSCLRVHRENCDGFALSMHLYKSCTDEFAFVDEKAREAKKGNPENDFFWNVDLPKDDRRLTDAKCPPDFGDAINPTEEVAEALPGFLDGSSRMYLAILAVSLLINLLCTMTAQKGDFG